MATCCFFITDFGFQTIVVEGYAVGVAGLKVPFRWNGKKHSGWIVTRVKPL